MTIIEPDAARSTTDEAPVAVRGAVRALLVDVEEHLAATVAGMLAAHHVDVDRHRTEGPHSGLADVVTRVRDEDQALVVWCLDDVGPADRLGATLAAVGRRDVVVVAAPRRVRSPEDLTRLRRRISAAALDAGGLLRASASTTEVRRPTDLGVLLDRVCRESKHPDRVAAAVALVDLADRQRLRTRLGASAVGALLDEVAGTCLEGASSLEIHARDDEGRVLVVVQDRDDAWVEHRLTDISERLARRPVVVDEEVVTMTPTIGWSRATGAGARVVGERVERAVEEARALADLRPVPWTPRLRGQPDGRRGLPHGVVAAGQVAVTFVVGMLVPFALLVTAESAGVGVTGYVHAAVVAVLVVTGLSVWAEGIASLRRDRPPPPLDGPGEPMTVVVAAYLPNEAATVVDTLVSVLDVARADDRVLLAYNRPRHLPVEVRLRELARADPRLVLHHVTDSTSKAQNVNSALAWVETPLVAVYDADHHPAPDALDRARRWLGADHDVVQGRCAVRNGRASLVSRLVAVEFESIYGVSHQGRSRMHGFALFGGSNGYWRTEVLRRVRLRSSMLTEDIDASIRLLADGGRIAYDRGIVTRELAPASLPALWSQRIRWAQGWFQVTRTHGAGVWNTFALSGRARVGMTFLLQWREMTPWVGQLVVPLLLTQLWAADWQPQGMPRTSAVLLVALAGLAAVPAQVLFAWRSATPELRRHPWWFVLFLVVGSLVYAEGRNLVARVSHVRELLGVKEWVVTPRPAAGRRSAT